MIIYVVTRKRYGKPIYSAIKYLSPREREVSLHLFSDIFHDLLSFTLSTYEIDYYEPKVGCNTFIQIVLQVTSVTK